MSNYKNECRLCDKLVISQSVTFTGGNLIINIPAGAYNDNCKYCIVVAQNIPANATINAPVFITIGTGTVLYPLTTCDCTQATACRIHSRTKYSTRVETTPSGGTFHMLVRNRCCCQNNNLRSINGTTPVSVANAAE